MRRQAKAASATPTPQRGALAYLAHRAGSLSTTVLLTFLIALVFGAIPALAAEPPSDVFAAFAAPRTDTTARLNGYVNPKGTEATYRFQYSLDGVNWTTLGDKKTAASSKQIVVGEEVGGLQPQTTYHYRFTVENEAGPVQSDEKTFETRSAAEMQIPARGMELVNQPNKGNQNVFQNPPITGQSPTSEDGSKAMWTVTSGAPGSNSSNFGTFVATRTPSGWQSNSAIPPAQNQFGDGELTYKLNEANSSFTRFLFHVAISGAFTEGPATFVRTDDQGNEDDLHSFTLTETNERIYGLSEMTEDLAHVLFVDPATEQLEDYGSGTPEVVSDMPDDEPNECGLPFEGQAFTGIGTGAVAAAKQWRPGYRRMARTDGSRVYFQAVENGSPCSSPLGIYYRDRSAGETIQIDDGAGGKQAAIIRTTPDGGSVFFVTASSHSAADANSTGDVYRWDSGSGDYTCITCVVPEAALELEFDTDGFANYEPVLVSDDFSHVYFTSAKQLVAGHGQEGDANLYAIREGQLKFVTDFGSSEGSPLTSSASELSPSGNVLTFRNIAGSNLEPTADEVASSCPSLYGEFGANRCIQVYRYGFGNESIECLSCNHEGVTLKKLGSAGQEYFFKTSADGSTTAFVTGERLLPEDVNNSEDVYEWHNGKLKLVTDGETIYPYKGLSIAPKVYGIDETGDNIFVTLIDPGLTGYEQDNLVNLYDSRVGGGFPRPEPPVHCSEESCQGPLLSPPSDQQAGSGSLVGEGNQKPAAKTRSCARKQGKAKRRCSRKRQHRKHRQHRASKAQQSPARRGSK